MRSRQRMGVGRVVACAFVRPCFGSTDSLLLGGFVQMLGELRRFAAGLAKPVKAMPKGSADPEAQPQYVKVRERERKRTREREKERKRERERERERAHSLSLSLQCGTISQPIDRFGSCSCALADSASTFPRAPVPPSFALLSSFCLLCVRGDRTSNWERWTLPSGPSPSAFCSWLCRSSQRAGRCCGRVRPRGTHRKEEAEGKERWREGG